MNETIKLIEKKVDNSCCYYGVFFIKIVKYYNSCLILKIYNLKILKNKKYNRQWMIDRKKVYDANNSIQAELGTEKKFR